MRDSLLNFTNDERLTGKDIIVISQPNPQTIAIALHPHQSWHGRPACAMVSVKKIAIAL
jgi:hypothetical protein